MTTRSYDDVKTALQQSPKSWLVTGAAGFIGSNLVETLLNLGQIVVGLDNFSTGHQHNLTDLESVVDPSAMQRFRMFEGDIRSIDACRRSVADADFVLHQAALGSVPRSIEDPVTTNAVNIDGFVNMLVAARDEGVSRFRLCGLLLDLWRSRGPAQGRRSHRQTALPLRRHEICQRDLR